MPIRALLASLACACMLFLQVQVQLHLSLNEHALTHEHGDHVHVLSEGALGAHRHHEAGGTESSDPTHEPHPMDEHELAEFELLQLPHHTVLALAPATSGVALPSLTSSGRLLERAGRRERPPPRWGGPPRGPPALS